MALIIDIGNSRLKICSWDGLGQVEGLLDGLKDFGQDTLPALSNLFSFDHPHEASEFDDLRRALRLFWAGRQYEDIIVVSTVPALTVLVCEEKPHAQVIDNRGPLPFPTTLLNLEQVGPDRLCNIAAAVKAGLTNALVVDAGTATTFDLLKDGVFCGGLIAPGMAFSAKKLGQEASLLAPVPFAPCPLKVGTNTVSAMAAGGFHVGIQGVQGVIRGLLSEYGDIPVIMTGGVGRFISYPGALHDPHWTQRGAAVIAHFDEVS